MSCASAMAPTAFYEQGAFLLAVKPNGDGGLRTNLKGRMNFSSLGTAPGHIITLSDSNFQKTISTANNRPANDAADAFIGYDQGDGNPGNIGISMGAPKSISNYIGNAGDGKNFLERLTANLKMFTVPVSIPSIPPAHASDPCTAGTQTWDANFIYICTAKNTWKRSPLSAW
jgi:hypothetical protein